MVRELAYDVLSASGYEVLLAANGGDALRIFERRQGRIDLRLTDVVMPEMSGLELAQRLKGSKPNLKVLYMSGYTDQMIVHHGLLVGEDFLQKPFAPLSLAHKVRKVLDEEPGE